MSEATDPRVEVVVNALGGWGPQGMKAEAQRVLGALDEYLASPAVREARVADLLDEIERLREALVRLLAAPTPGVMTATPSWVDAVAHARSVLEPKVDS